MHQITLGSALSLYAVFHHKVEEMFVVLTEQIKPPHPTHWLNVALSHFLTCYRYSIDRRTDMDHLFNVHPGNGSVFLLKSLDREETAWHNISIIATELRKSGRGQDFSRGWFDVLMQIKTYGAFFSHSHLSWRPNLTGQETASSATITKRFSFCLRFYPRQ